jgi:TIR domain
VSRRLFISYRRSDAAAAASSVRLALLACAPAVDQVFFDNADIDHGRDWRQAIVEALEASDTCLVLMGPDWLKPAPGAAQPRLLEPDDVVAFEVKTALEKPGMKIIPVLLEGAAWSSLAELPEPFNRLAKLKGPEIRQNHFDDDLRVFIDREIHGVGSSEARKNWAHNPNSWRWLWSSSTVLASLGIALAVWRPWSSERVPDTPQSAAASQASLANAEIHFTTRPSVDARGLSTQTLVFGSLEPKRSAMLAERQGSSQSKPLVFTLDGILLPQGGQPLFGLLERAAPAEGFKFDEDTAEDSRTRVCLKRSVQTKLADQRLQLNCKEGGECRLQNGAEFGLANCGEKSARSPSWLEALPFATAHAQAETATSRFRSTEGIWATVPQPRAGDWRVAPLEVLRARRLDALAHRADPGAGSAGFGAIELRSDSLPAMAHADELAWQVSVNGTRVWFGTLPAWSYAKPFKASEGVKVSFGLENLDASGAHRGLERVSVRLLFLKDKQTVATQDLSFDYTSLRNQFDPVPIRTESVAAAARYRWSAEYCPGSKDRFQILLAGKKTPEPLEATRAAIKKASLSINGQRVIGVLRPPDPPSSSAWSLALGLSQPNGQVRWIFDEVQTKVLCKQVAQQHAWQALGLDPKRASRLAVARECGEPALSRPLLPCY